MGLTNYDTVIRLGVVAALAAGVVFITVGGTALATAGVLLVILGLVSLMAVVRNGLTGRETGKVVP